MGGNSDKNKNHTEVDFRSHNETRECIQEDESSNVKSQLSDGNIRVNVKKLYR